MHDMGSTTNNRIPAVITEATIASLCRVYRRRVGVCDGNAGGETGIVSPTATCKPYLSRDSTLASAVSVIRLERRKRPASAIGTCCGNTGSGETWATDVTTALRTARGITGSSSA